MIHRVVGPTHRRQGSDPPVSWDLTTALLAMSEEDLRCKSGELFVGAERINFVAVCPSSSSDVKDDVMTTVNTRQLRKKLCVRSDSSESPYHPSSRLPSGLSTGSHQQRSNRQHKPVVSASDTSSDHDGEGAGGASTGAPSKFSRGIRGGYRCSKCGQRKVNHICSMLDSQNLVLTCAVGTQTNVIVSNEGNDPPGAACKLLSVKRRREAEGDGEGECLSSSSDLISGPSDAVAVGASASHNC
jgi:hypothetical protein